MSARTPAEAASEILSSLQLAVSCVTDGVLRSYPTERTNESLTYIATFSTGSARVSATAIAFLSVRHWFRILRDAPGEGYRVQTAGYHYAIEDREHNEIITYHWHPQTGSHIVRPHAHLRTITKGTYGQLAGVHLPTGRISLEEVIRLAIDPGARATRRDWKKVLERTEKVFLSERRW